MKRLRPEIPLIVLLLAVTVGLGSAARPRSREPQTAVILIENMRFSPRVVRIRPGDAVEFKNFDLVPHNVTERAAKRFDSGMINRNEAWQFIADQAGTFEYRCIYHPDMTGSIIVGERTDSVPRDGTVAVELCGD